MDRELIDEMSEALEYAKSNTQPIRERLEKELTDLVSKQAASGVDSSELLSKEDTTNLINFIIESLTNHSVKVLGKNNFTCLLSVLDGPGNGSVCAGKESIC